MKLVVGDRVRVYGRMPGNPDLKEYGSVIAILSSSSVRVLVKSGFGLTADVSVKQCRKLKSKQYYAYKEDTGSTRYFNMRSGEELLQDILPGTSYTREPKVTDSSPHRIARVTVLKMVRVG